MIMSNTASQKSHCAVGGQARKGRVRRRRRRVHVTLLMGAAAIAFLALALVYVGQRTHIMTLSYQVEALNKSVADALREQEFLQLRMAQAHSLAHVEQVATGRLGMVRPEATQYIVLDESARMTVAANHSESAEERPRGLLAMAVDWVAQHWPRMETAEAGGERR